MDKLRVGSQTLIFGSGVSVCASSTIVGPMEAAGPLGKYFDKVLPDTKYGEKCWEGTESKMLKEVCETVIRNAKLTEQDIDLIVTSDLLNQLAASNYAVREVPISHLGVYSACASYAEGMIIAGMALTGGFAEKAVVAVSSHHDAAERQYRFPTELGVQRPPWAQWTVTGAAATYLCAEPAELRLTEGTIGRVVDYGIKDPYDMGGAMAPAAADTIEAHLRDLGRSPDYYDMILTGDLGAYGLGLLRQLLAKRGIEMDTQLEDCGALIYDRDKQDVHSGGSGMACSAAVFNSYVVKQFRQRRIRRALLVCTGALHNPTRVKQSESIPTVAHAVSFAVV